MPDLAVLGDFAEQYLYSDPASSLVKLRTFTENSVRKIYDELDIGSIDNDSLMDLMKNTDFIQTLSPELISKLHSLRIYGNKAAHGQKISSDTAQWLLREAHDISKWMYLSFCDGDLDKIPKFILPEKAPTEDRDNQLAQKEIAIQKLLKEIYENKSTFIQEKRGKQHYKDIASRSKSVANQLQFNEEQTRFKLIDSMLKTSGWDVKPNKENSPTVKQELLVKHQPTDTGDGYVDYVLWDDERDKPLAVIEAKKTSVSAKIGQTQAKMYADGLEKEYGFRPVIFFTNGYEIYIWDDVRGYPERRIYGYYNKESLEFLIKKRNANRLQDTDTGDIADRGYQLEGIQRLKEAFDQKKRRGLLVQATGTGKTRVAISFSEVLLKSMQGKRILFLCDRKELRKQAFNAFKEHLPEYPRLILSSKTSEDHNKRIYFSTYPAMMKAYEKFDIGFLEMY